MAGLRLSGVESSSLDGRVVGGRCVDDRRQLDELQDDVVVEPIREHAETTANGRLAVAGHIPREPDARRHLDGGRVEHPFVEDLDAIRRIAGVRRERADFDRRQDFAGDRVDTTTTVRRADRLNQQRRLAGVELIRQEHGQLIVLAGRRSNAIEAHARIDREVLPHAPVVLNEPFDVCEAGVGVWVLRRFRVAVDRADERVGVRVIGIERVGGVAVEVEAAVERARARRRAGWCARRTAPPSCCARPSPWSGWRRCSRCRSARRTDSGLRRPATRFGRCCCQAPAPRRRSSRWGECATGSPPGKTAAGSTAPPGSGRCVPDRPE